MRRHELDVLSLVFGLFFLGAAAIWGTTSDNSMLVRGWPLPVLLIAVGVVGLLASVRSRRPRLTGPTSDATVAGSGGHGDGAEAGVTDHSPDHF